MTVKKTDTESELTSALTQALVALGRAGQVDGAMRIAGRAFAGVRHEAPRAAQQINNVMHGLAKMPGPSVPSSPDHRSHKENPDE